MKRGIRAVCLLAGLGLLWLGAGDGIWQGSATQSQKLLARRCGEEKTAEGSETDDRECLWLRQIRDDKELEQQICMLEALPIYDTYRELREYLQTLHPGLQNCRFHTYEVGQYCAEPFIMLTTEEAEYGYYSREGQWYRVRWNTTEDTSYENLWSDRNNLGYDYQESYWWDITEEGCIAETDLILKNHYFEVDIGGGRMFSFEGKCLGSEKGELLEDSTYQVDVSEAGADHPFQVLEITSAMWEPFSFEDFNADGYLDLTVLYYYGANGGTAEHYIWSPSEGQYVMGPEELEYFGFYGIDDKNRQLNMHHHGSAVSGTEYLYQWSGEMDCELIRYFDHDAIYDCESGKGLGVQVEVISFENGREKVLSDYLYPDEEYFQRDEIWGIYYCDFIWEQEVVLEGQERPCILRYAQSDEQDGQRDAYTDHIFLFREDTYLICALNQEKVAAAYEELCWDEKAQQLIVSYEDGTTQSYQWDGLDFRSL